MHLPAFGQDGAHPVLAEQSRLLQLIVSNANLRTCFSELTRSAETLLPGVRTAVVIADDGPPSIHGLHSESMPPSMQDFFRGPLIDESPFGARATAVFQGKPWSCPDLGKDADGSKTWRDAMMACGVRACHSIPILSSDRTAIGFFLLGFPEAHSPDTQELAVGEVGALLAGLAMERDRASRALVENEQRFYALGKTTSDVIFELTPDGAKIRRLYGRDLSQVQETAGRDWLERYVDAADRELVQKEFQSAIQDKRPFALEHRVRRSNGSVGWMLSRALPLFDQFGEITGWFGSATDITERKLGAEALMKAERLSVAGRMAAMVAHEINNPLGSIANLLYLAMVDGSMSSAARGYLGKAGEELERASRIVRQTLGFYRGSAAPTRVDVAAIAADVLQICRPKADGREMTLENDGVAPVYVSPGELRQVLTNLVSNAMDATDPTRGRIRLRVASRLGICQDGAPRRGVRITIADNGNGIERAGREKIFEAFFTTKKDVGTGLGLWVTSTILRKYGARIRLRSSVRPGSSGTIFSIFWPPSA